MNLNPIREKIESPSSSPTSISSNSSAASPPQVQHNPLSNSLPSSSSSDLTFAVQDSLSSSAHHSSTASSTLTASWSTTPLQQSSQQSSFSRTTPALTRANNGGGLISSSSSAASLFAQNSSYLQSTERANHEKSPSIGSMPANIKDAPTVLSHSQTPAIQSTHRNYSVFDAPIIARELERAEIRDGLLGQNDGWQTLCIKVLPLFNGEGLKMCIEDLNELVRQCINDKQLELYKDINELLGFGMSTLNSKLRDVPDEKLVSRLNELWSFYFGTVIPYFEGVFLPLQIQASQQNHSATGGEEMSVRRLVLMSFRDQVILPMRDRVDDAFNKLFHDFDSGIPVADTAARMLQMTYILSSILSDDEKQREMDRVLAKLKNNWKLFMKRDRRGFVDMSANVYTDSASSSVETSTVTTPTTPTPNVGIGVSATTSPAQ